MTLHGVTWPDVVAVFAHSRFGQFLLALVVGYCLIVGYGFYRARRARRFKPSSLPFTEFEMRSIPGLSPRRTWDQPAAKGFKADYQHTVVPFTGKRVH